MSEMLLDPPVVRMPDFAPGTWLNTTSPLTKQALRGQLLLIDFWDYSCINCLRTLPYLLAWHQRYADSGLTIIGIHAPEFKFGQAECQVEAAIAELGIHYPVLLDNQFANWDRFATRAWPTKYLVDEAGYIRLKQQGEGGYERIERGIQALFRRLNLNLTLPPVLPPLRPEDQPGAVCYPVTPELHAGSVGGLFGGALGNPEGYLPDRPVAYAMPDAAERSEGQFYLDGFWQAGPECLAFAGRDGGRILLPYRAVGVNAVLSYTSDPVELLLEMHPSTAVPLVELRQDGRPLSRENAGADVVFDDAGHSLVRVGRPRMMTLVQNPDFGAHELELIFHASGLTLYTFTFTSCITAGPPDRAAEG